MHTLEQLLMDAGKKEMVAFLQTHPAKVEQAIELGLTQQQPLAWRAVWALEEALEPNDPTLLPYLARVIDFLPQADDGHARQWLRILQGMELPDTHLAALFDFCMQTWCLPNKQPSVRYQAYLTMERIAALYPELKNELEASLSEPALDSLSPGIRHSLIKRRGRKLLR